MCVVVATPGPTRCPAGLLVQHPPGSRNFAGTSTHCPIDFWSFAGMAHTTHCPIDFWGFAEPAHTKGESMQEMYFFFIDCCHYSRARATTKSAYESSRLDSWFISPPPQRTTQPAFFNLSLRNTPWPVLVLSAFSHAATTWVSANCHCSGGIAFDWHHATSSNFGAAHA